MPARRLLPFTIPRAANAFAIIFCAIWLLHGALLRLPYFWDEAGYFIPAARDLLLTGDLIPHTTLSNAHPPLVMVWLAAWWKFSNYAPAVTRTAMLLFAAFGLLGLWKLAERVVNAKVAGATVILTALYPVVFAQSSLAQLDIPAMALTLWGLYFYLGERRLLAVLTFAFAALAKETALITPFTIAGWELLSPFLLGAPHLPQSADVGQRFSHQLATPVLRPQHLPGAPHLPPGEPGAPHLPQSADVGLPWPQQIARTSSLLCSAVPLLAWYAFHYHRTGYVFGNPEYLQYNLDATLSPLRILFAFAIRCWHTLGYMNLFVLTAAALVVAREPVVTEPGGERKGIESDKATLFALLILAHIIAFSIVGGAALARYMVPVIPLVILLAVTALYRHMRAWAVWCALSGAAFVIALLFNPPWRIAPEDNLAYSDFVHLHANAAAYLQQNHPGANILTAWPGSDELNRPFLGYVKRPMTVVRIEDFSPPQIMAAVQQRDSFDGAFLFNTKYDPPTNILSRLGWWNRIQQRFFGYHRDLRPEEVALLMQGRIVWEQHRGGQWAAVIMIEHVQNAGIAKGSPSRSPFR